MKQLEFKKFCVVILNILMMSGILFAQSSQYKYSFRNPNLSLEERVNDLISRMTLEEKVLQMQNNAPAIERLGVPEYNWWNECLHGVARAGVATVFPQAIGIAATYDTELMRNVATAISDEARAKYNEFQRHNDRGQYHGLTFWSPNINIFRDPRWGRGQETYGEDPYLTSRMGVEFVKGLQGDNQKYLKVVATPKHYAVHSGPEPERHKFNAITTKRDLRETYLPAFRACIEEGHAYSVMGAYNRYLGEACNASELLLQHYLRDKWGFAGYVVSDCGAIYDIWAFHKIVKTPEEAAALAVKEGCDLNCGDQFQYLAAAVKKGLIAEPVIDKALRRLFTARFKLGMFDPPELVPYSKIPYSVNDSKEHRELALKSARESIVLLKNENHTLPLNKNIKSIAVIGPNASDSTVVLGNYNGFPSKTITVLEGIKNKVSSGTKVYYSPGTNLTDTTAVLKAIPSMYLTCEDNGKTVNGLTGEYYKNTDLSGEPSFSRVDTVIDFDVTRGFPGHNFGSENFSVRWQGNLTVPVSGDYTLGVTGDDGYRLFINGKEAVEYWSSHSAWTKKKAIHLKKGKKCNLKLEYFQGAVDGIIRLEWAMPSIGMFDKALTAAKKADVIVMVGGISPRLEGEEMNVSIKGFKGGDRTSLKLPDVQIALLKKLKATGKPVVLILMSGSALAVNWADKNLPAIVQAWYGGEEAGGAIADVLFGDYNPAGRLPVTFYKSVDQLPPFEDYDMKGRTYRYFSGKPLYPFGYGLSYTEFNYSNMVLPPEVEPGKNINIKVDVENSGKTAGDEVVQLYVKDLKASAPVPVRSLQGIKRIHLLPGEKKTVEFTLTPRQLSLIDKNMKRIVEAGEFEITIGGKQPGFKGHADASTTGTVSKTIKVKGNYTVED